MEPRLRTVTLKNTKRALTATATVIAASAVIISSFIWTTYGEGDRIVPIVFLAVETVVALWAVGRSWTEANSLRGLLQKEERVIWGLSSSGAQLGDSMVYVGDARRDKTGEYQEVSATWANFLIVVGMCGTAGYLVYHAGSFVTAGENDLTSSLANLLPLAPKAFAATGFALFCAAALALASGFSLRTVEESAASAQELSRAWEGGLTQRSRHDSNQLTDAFAAALDLRIADKLDVVAQRVESASKASTLVAIKMEEGMEHSARLVQAAAAAQYEASEHSQVVSQRLKELATHVSEMAERTIDTAVRVAHLEAQLSETAGEAVAKMDALYQQLLHKMSNSAQEFAPEILKSVTERLLETVQQHINELFTQNVDQVQQIQDASFAQARKSFEEHIGPVSNHVRSLSEDMGTLDEALRGVGGILVYAAKQWPEAAERAVCSINDIRTALMELAKAPSPQSLDGVVQALKSATKTFAAVAADLSEAVTNLDGAVEHARTVGKIEGILRA